MTSASSNYPTNEDAFTQAERIFKEDGDYRSSGSIEKANRYIDALTTMLPMLPQQMRGGGSAGELVMYDIRALLELKKDAVSWVTSQKTFKNGRVSAVSFQGGFRR